MREHDAVHQPLTIDVNLDFDRHCLLGPSADEQNRVVSRDRAGDLRQLRPVDPFGEALRLAAVRSHDNQGLDALERPDEARHRPPQLFADRLACALLARARIGAVAGALDETQLFQIAGQCGLRGGNAAIFQFLPQSFLRRDRLAVNDVEDL